MLPLRLWATLDSSGIRRQCLSGHRLLPTKVPSPLGLETGREHSVLSACSPWWPSAPLSAFILRGVLMPQSESWQLGAQGTQGV